MARMECPAWCSVGRRSFVHTPIYIYIYIVYIHIYIYKIIISLSLYIYIYIYCRVLIPLEVWKGFCSCEVARGGATRKVQEFTGLRLRRQVAAGRRDRVHPRCSAGDMANSLAISSRRFPYSNGLRMPLLQA